MILVTGGTGLVGAHLLLHLCENEAQQVRAIFRNPSGIEKTKTLFRYYAQEKLFDLIEWVEADIIDIPSLENAFNDVDYVYHCAAAISFNPDDENILRKVNIEGTANIVNFCIAKKVKKICHVSSIAALGDLPPDKHDNQMITEQTEWNPEVAHSDYAISKYGAEMEVWRGQQEGLATIIVNPGIILGPYPNGWDKSKGSGALFHTIKKGMPFYTHGLTAYVAVTDVVTLMHLLMQSAISGERFIVIAENISYRDIIFRIADKIKAKKPKREAKKWMLLLGLRIDQLLSFVFRTRRRLSQNSVNSLLQKDIISNQKIVQQLNYTFEPIDAYLDKISDCYR